VEFALVAGIFLADIYHWRHIIWLSKTLYLLALGWISLRLRGLGWKNVGLRLYRGWAPTLALGAAVGVGIELLELFVTQPLLVRLTHHAPDLADFQDLRGNLKLLALVIVGTWTLAAFGEEMVYRGYLMNRVAGLFGGQRPAWSTSLAVVSMVFGLAHLYQGMTGVIENVIDGFLLGLAYLRWDRKLSVSIVAHGVTDTVDFLLIFLGKYPGM
jgi:membrane protease YdiL (CAAX protease family)